MPDAVGEPPRQQLAETMLIAATPETAAIRAGKLMIREMEHHGQHGHSFGFETTLSGRRDDKAGRQSTEVLNNFLAFLEVVMESGKLVLGTIMLKSDP